MTEQFSNSKKTAFVQPEIYDCFPVVEDDTVTLNGLVIKTDIDGKDYYICYETPPSCKFKDVIEYTTKGKITTDPYYSYPAETEGHTVMYDFNAGLYRIEDDDGNNYALSLSDTIDRKIEEITKDFMEVTYENQ